MLWFYWFQEDLIEIEFVERQPAPKPEDSLLHDDWVSCLQGCKEWSVLGRLYVGGGGVQGKVGLIPLYCTTAGPLYFGERVDEVLG